MARLFDDGSSEYLNINQAVVNVPLAMVAWFNSNDLTIEQTIIGVSDASVQAHYNRMILSGSLGGDPIRAQTCEVPGAGCKVATTSTGCSVDTWHHGCALFVSATDRRILLDGAGKATNADSRTATNLDRTTIGYVLASPSHQPFSGMIAEAAIWDLSVYPGANDGERADYFEARILPSLVVRYTPDNSPLGLVAYWDLIRGLNDKFGGYNLTASGTVVAAHPRIIQPCGIL